MALYKRDGSPDFWTEFDFNGTRYRESTGTWRRRKAEQYERKRRLELHDAVKLGNVPHEAMRFEDAAKRYITTHLKTKDRQPKTHLSDVYTLARLTTLVGADTLLDQITTPVVARLKETLLDEQARAVVYDLKELDELTLSYATTVHKSQGSEYPAVVIPVHTQHFPMLQRNLLYTAMTRGKKLVVLVGTNEAVALAVKRFEVDRRVTTLTERLNLLNRPVRGPAGMPAAAGQ